jgi:hypothetical protein
LFFEPFRVRLTFKQVHAELDADFESVEKIEEEKNFLQNVQDLSGFAK